MGVFAYPGPSSALPLPEPVTPLVETLCSTCGGCGYSEGVSTAGEDVAARCGDCDGRGAKLVCPTCGVTPNSETDACACNSSRCEKCDEYADTREGLCARCFKEGMKLVIEEEDPQYEVWRTEQLELGYEFGWLEREQVTS